MSDVTPEPDGSASTFTSKETARVPPRAIVALVLLVAALILVFSNTADVSVRFLMVELSAPGWIMLLCLLGIGIVIGFLLGRGRYKRK